MNKYIFIGSYTEYSADSIKHNDGHGICVYRMDGKTFSPVCEAADIINPGFLAISPDNTRLYAGGEADSYGIVAAYEIDPSNAELRLMNTVETPGSGLCHVAVNDRTLFAAYYSSGDAASFRIAADGSVEKYVSMFRNIGKSINPVRQDHAYTHSVTPDPTGKFAISADLGMDKLTVYRVNRETSEMTEVSSNFVRAGEGPRHLTFHPNGKYAYLSTEMGCCVVVFDWDAEKGVLTEKQIIETLRPTKIENTGADLHITKSGRFLYMTNRGDNEIVCLDVAADGTLSFGYRKDCGGNWPRNFAFDSDEKFLAIANQFSGDVTFFDFDAESGVIGNPFGKIDLPQVSFVTVRDF